MILLGNKMNVNITIMIRISEILKKPGTGTIILSGSRKKLSSIIKIIKTASKILLFLNMCINYLFNILAIFRFLMAENIDLISIMPVRWFTEIKITLKNRAITSFIK